MPEAASTFALRLHGHHPWGRLFLAPGAAHPAAVPAAVADAAAALRGLWGRGPETPLDLTLDPACLVPTAWPQAVPPRLLLPSPPVRPCRKADLVHELAHLVAFVPRARLLSEGMAVASAYLLAADGVFPVAGDAQALHDCARAAGGPRLRDLTESGACEGDLRVNGRPFARHRAAYARAGSFVLHLVTSRGAARVLNALDRLFAEPGLSQEDALHGASGEPLDVLEATWLAAGAGSEERR